MALAGWSRAGGWRRREVSGPALPPAAALAPVFSPASAPDHDPVQAQTRGGMLSRDMCVSSMTGSCDPTDAQGEACIPSPPPGPTRIPDDTPPAAATLGWAPPVSSPGSARAVYPGLPWAVVLARVANSALARTAARNAVAAATLTSTSTPTPTSTLSPTPTSPSTPTQTTTSTRFSSYHAWAAQGPHKPPGTNFECDEE